MENDKNKNPLVSVVIPTKNRAKLLERAIKSVLVQGIDDYEIIVVIDGAMDETEQIVNAFNDKRIIVYRHEISKGASAARNTAMRHSRGKYIAFLDDDDEWTPDKLEVQLPVIQNSGETVGLVYAWMEYVQDGKITGIRAPELKGDVFVEMLDKQAIGGCPTIIIKRSVMEKVGCFDENLPRGNDGDYWRRICRNYNVDYVPKVLAKVYIGHQDRISTRKTPENIDDGIRSKMHRMNIFRDDFKRHSKPCAKLYARISYDYLCRFSLSRKYYDFLKYLKYSFFSFFRAPLSFFWFRSCLRFFCTKNTRK